DFEPPKSGVTQAKIDPKTGKLVRGEGGITENFLVGTAPTEYAPAKEEGSEDNFLMEQFQSAEKKGEKAKKKEKKKAN
ncbi:MAG: hypothetical protein ABEN55_05560, partial [Bradymonadaceae bacterium]